MSFHLDSPWGATLNDAGYRAFAMGSGRNRILSVGKNSGPILSRLWTKVHELLEQCRDPLYFLICLSELSCFVLKIFVIKSLSRRKSLFVPIFDPDFSISAIHQNLRTSNK